MSAPKLRMFAGPNGSGKSTMKSVVPAAIIGHYLNPDDIEADIRRTGFFDPRTLGVTFAASAATISPGPHSSRRPV